MSHEPLNPAPPKNPKKSFLRAKRTNRPSRTQNFFGGSLFISIPLLSLFGIALIVICFLGLPVAGPNTYVHQKTPQRVLSSITFSYESALRTKIARDERSNRVHPVYVISEEPYNKFEGFWALLMERLNDLEPEKTKTDLFTGFAEGVPVEEFRLVAEDIARQHNFNLSPSDIEILFKATDPDSRDTLSQIIIPIMKSLFSRGIYSSNNEIDDGQELSGIIRLSFLQTGKEMSSKQMESLEEAEKTLYATIINSKLRHDAEFKESLSRILQEALAANIEYDEVLTSARRKEAMERVKPIIERIQEGDIVVDTGSDLTDVDLERLAAYRNELKQRQVGYSWVRFKQEVFLTALILSAVFLFLRATNSQVLRDNRKVAFTVLLILLQLGITRLLIDVTDSSVFSQRPITPYILPYLIPYPLAPILLGVLLGLGPGLFISVLIGLFTALMFNGSPLMLIISVFSAVVGLYFSQNIRRRSKLVKSGFMAGVATAICPIILGLAFETAVTTILIQIALTLSVGFISGTLLVGILPLIENLFKFTTDITLLELTDYNHPLLRDLQMKAPGTYHHSMMLANLCENASAAIGANPILSRVCCYYHDIGKLVKPEYFVENQRDGVNPHIERNPSMSALVIKSHVKEGIRMARQHKLPAVILDVIQQHHGTTLIRFFYARAKEQERQKTQNPFGIPTFEIAEISESTYRYDGPRPQFKESAIILLGDAVEAASRTLRKVTAQSIEELIDELFEERIHDGQLDESPLTFAEVHKIKKSFAFTLVNAMHARIEYPNKKEDKSPSEKKENLSENSSEKEISEISSNQESSDSQTNQTP